MGIPQKIKNIITISNNPILGIYPKELKVRSQRNIFISMFITALLTVAKMWKQPKHPSTDEWISKMWYIHTMEYYLALKKEYSDICSNMNEL